MHLASHHFMAAPGVGSTEDIGRRWVPWLGCVFVYLASAQLIACQVSANSKTNPKPTTLQPIISNNN